MPHTADLPPAIFLMGPTASGKTDLAIALGERLPVTLISVDSAMVYRGMDIGTAKPEPAVLARAPHKLIDILDPAESYSAAQFREDALREMAAATAAGRIPLLVGGTMLYFRALEQGMAELPQADPVLRRTIEEEAARIGWHGLHARLAQVDPAAAQRIHPNDPQRLQRALEVYELTGRPMSELWRNAAMQSLPYRITKLVVAPAERAWLHERIARRFVLMLEAGFLAEVERLFARGDLGPELPSIRCVGYRQAWGHLAGEWDYAAMVDKGIAATRQLAKRQYTWLRGGLAEKEWLDARSPHVLERALARLQDAQVLSASE